MESGALVSLDEYFEFVFLFIIPFLGGVSAGIAASYFYLSEFESKNLGMLIVIFMVSSVPTGFLLLKIRGLLSMVVIYVFWIVISASVIALAIWMGIEASLVKL